jgi:hypothetical protein
LSEQLIVHKFVEDLLLKERPILWAQSAWTELREANQRLLILLARNFLTVDSCDSSRQVQTSNLPFNPTEAAEHAEDEDKRDAQPNCPADDLLLQFLASSPQRRHDFHLGSIFELCVES